MRRSVLRRERGDGRLRRAFENILEFVLKQRSNRQVEHSVGRQFAGFDAAGKIERAQHHRRSISATMRTVAPRTKGKAT